MPRQRLNVQDLYLEAEEVPANWFRQRVDLQENKAWGGCGWSMQNNSMQLGY